MKKIILCFILVLLSNAYQDVNTSTLKGVKPFTVYVSTYHVFGDKTETHEVDIGKKIKVIDFDGSTFKITRMAKLKSDETSETHGPVLEKNKEPVLVSLSDKDFNQVMEEILNIRYEYIHEGQQNVVFSYFSNDYPTYALYMVMFVCGSNKRIFTNIKYNQNNSKQKNIGLLDENYQYHSYAISNGDAQLTNKLAVYPDKYDVNLPLLKPMFEFMRTQKKYYGGYI